MYSNKTDIYNTYVIIDTGQELCYDDSGNAITCPAEGQAFYGQDAQFTGAAFDYADNGDGTVTDNVTGLVWQQTPDSQKYSWDDAQTYCDNLVLGDRDDWRMPTISEVRTIINGCPATELGGSCGVTIECTDVNECWNESCNGCNHSNGPGENGCYWNTQLRGNCDMYWSSTVFGSLNYVWISRFDYGDVFYDDNVEYGFLRNIRCVSLIK